MQPFQWLELLAECALAQCRAAQETRCELLGEPEPCIASISRAGWLGWRHKLALFAPLTDRRYGASIS